MDQTTVGNRGTGWLYRSRLSDQAHQSALPVKRGREGKRPLMLQCKQKQGRLLRFVCVATIKLARIDQRHKGCAILDQALFGASHDFVGQPGQTGEYATDRVQPPVPG